VNGWRPAPHRTRGSDHRDTSVGIPVGDGESGPIPWQTRVVTSPAENEQWPLTLEEYLRFEALSDVRHEYVGGQVYAMTEGSRRHGQMAGFLVAALQQGLLEGPCRVYSHDTTAFEA
jgi:hypothetical protein